MASQSNFPDCLNQLLKNSVEDFLKAANLLLKIARNIKNNPNVEKYKSIQVGSRTLMENLLPVDGAILCLFEMGFEESGDRFVYNSSNSKRLRDMKSFLESAIQIKQKPKPASTDPKPTLHPRPSENDVHRRLEIYFERVLVYENLALQAKARSIIPTESLAVKASQKLSEGPQFAWYSGNIPLGYDDCLIMALLEWFKFEFFKWVDSPPCPNCPESKCVSSGMLTPTEEEMKWEASRVEGYTCTSCHTVVRYPRYNSPEKLLETRSGRCGEWANCFTLLCRSLGYDSRHVIDWTDHVWTEVYSKAAKRWIHCDPCENAFDKPLLYEEGWGKKLSLIVAVSCDEIVDVSWRYTDKPNDLMQRRKVIFREDWLANDLEKLNETRQRYFNPRQKADINNRMIKEIVEFNSPKIKSSVEYGGRTTGSIEWRSERGEMGRGIINNHRKICPGNTTGSTDSKIKLKYYSKTDKYSCNIIPDASGWASLTFSSTCMQRKVEHDWKMAYLARTESSERGSICWKFDLKDLDRNIIVKQANIKVESTVFESGNVKWLLCTENTTTVLENGVNQSFTEEVYGSRCLSIYAFLSGGNGGNSWQHTQLFRTSLDSKVDEPQMDIGIKYGAQL